MHCTFLTLVGVAAAVANAASVPKDDVAVMKRNIIARQARARIAKRDQSVTAASVGDANIIQFALTLEHLENKFYSDALAKFNADAFNKAGFSGGYALLEQVASDEAQHVEFLTSALQAAGATPVQACNYSFPYTDVKSFLGLSQIIEGVGVSAYLGAAGAINNSDYVTAAGSILTVEARHNAFVSFLNGYSPFPGPEDTPLSATNVVTLVTPFFTSCPNGSAPSIAGKPALNLTTTNVTTGANISITPANTTVASSFNGTVYCGFASGLGASFSTWTNGSCSVPTQNITNGQTYIVLTTGPSLADSSVVAGPAIALIGPQNVSVSVSGAAKGSSGSGSNDTNTSGAFKASVASLALGLVGVVALML